MEAVLRFIRREPAMIVSLILTALNLFLNLNEGQTEAVQNIVESVIILAGGTAIRQSVTPVGKTQAGA